MKFSRLLFLPAFTLFAAAPLAADLQSARELLLRGRYEEAQSAFEEIIEEQPEAASIGMARCLNETGKQAEVIELLEKALATHPHESIAAELAGLAFAQGDYAGAQEWVDTALVKKDDQPQARWIAAELHRTAGRTKQALQGYRWFVDFYNKSEKLDDETLLYVFQAAAQHARWTRNKIQFRFLVNDLSREILKAEPNQWRAHLLAGEIFLEKFNEAEAAKSLQAALAINSAAADIHAARARLSLERFDLPAAETSLNRALAIHPSHLAARIVQADLQLLKFDVAGAIDTLQSARKTNPRQEELLGRLAAAYGMADGLENAAADTRLGKVIAEATKANPHCGRFFASLADSLDRMRKYPQALAYYEEAQRRLPELIGVRAARGLVAMRLGDETAGAKLLAEAFEIDPFHVRVRNMLEVLDVLSGYAVLETEHFILKFDRGHDGLLAQYAARYLEEEVFPQVTEALGFEPPEKTLIEIFSRSKNTSGHGWFSARMVGLPYVGTVGACAGKMVALASPNDLPEKYNWARVLKHEFVHVVNLQQTNFNIPHWFTEALAVRSEGGERPQEWNDVLARRHAEGKLYSLADINFGFTRPGSGDDWTLAYCQAELYAEYMVKLQGDQSLIDMLAAYRENLRTHEAIEQVFGISQAEFEAGYQSFIDDLISQLPPAAAPQSQQTFAELHRAVKEDPKNAKLLAELSLAYLNRGDKPNARKLALACRELEPNNSLACYVLARVYLSIGDIPLAEKQLRSGLKEESPHADLVQLLAALKLREKNYAEAERLYKLGAAAFAGDLKWQKLLARTYTLAGENDKLTEALAIVAGREEDAVATRKRLAELAAEKEDLSAAIRWATEGIQVDVQDASLHVLLGKALAKQEKHEQAVIEFESALHLDTTQGDLRLALAESCIKTRQFEKAKAELEKYEVLHPDDPAAEKLRKQLP